MKDCNQVVYTISSLALNTPNKFCFLPIKVPISLSVFHTNLYLLLIQSSIMPATKRTTRSRTYASIQDHSKHEEDDDTYNPSGPLQREDRKNRPRFRRIRKCVLSSLPSSRKELIKRGQQICFMYVWGDPLFFRTDCIKLTHNLAGYIEQVRIV
jgi:hypothetical protein